MYGRRTGASSVVDSDRLRIGVLVRRVHARIAAEVGPARVEYTVAAHRAGRVVANEHALQRRAGYGADADDLDLRIRRLRRDAVHFRMREVAELLRPCVGVVEADSVRVVGSRVEAHRNLAIGRRDGRIDLVVAGADRLYR